MYTGGKELHKDNPDSKILTYSVIPSLYAWSAFILPHHYAFYYLSVRLVSVCSHDLFDKSLPSWYRKLRLPLAIMAASSVAVTGFNLS